MQFLGLAILIALVSSCGKSNSSAGLPIEKTPLPINGSNIVGIYMAKFDTLNASVNGNIPGSATLQRRDDSFKAYVRLFGGAPNAWHMQNIHTGRCPTPSDDMNSDGFVDYEEAMRALGPILLPLDSNLSSQAAGKNIYPIADSSGSYFYERMTTFTKMFADLKTEDQDPTDNMTKLDPESGLDFSGKVVVIHGAPDTAILPETVASVDNRPANQTLPIACGTFEQVRSIPGEPVPDTAPGPVGEGEVSTPGPGPQPQPQPQPGPTPEPREDEEDEDDENWYDRVIDWWRRTWERDRGGRRQTWGNGNGGRG